MSRLIISCILILASWSFADHSRLYDVHIQKIQMYGHSDLLAGEHSFVLHGHEISQTQEHSIQTTQPVYSVFAKDHQISSYTVADSYEIYNFCQIVDNNTEIIFKNNIKIEKNFEVETLNYDIIYRKKDGVFGCDVQIQKNSVRATDPLKVMECIFKHGLDLVPKATKCMELKTAKKKLNCLINLAKSQGTSKLINCIKKAQSVADCCQQLQTIPNDVDVNNVYWRIFVKTQGMGFVSVKLLGAKEECSTTTGCNHFVAPNGYKVVIEATPAPGYQFSYWQYRENLLSLEANYSYIPSGGGDLIAIFEKVE